MGHHIDAQGNFQSDKYPWLEPNKILLSPCDPAVRRAMKALRLAASPNFPGKLLLSLETEADRELLWEFLKATEDKELGDDLEQVLLNKFKWSGRNTA